MDNIKVGSYEIAACNVGANKAGLSEESYGELYQREMARTVCAQGYHLPTIEEWKSVVGTLL